MTRAKLILICFALATAGSIALIPRVVYDYDFEQFFPVGDPDLDYYKTFRERFEPDDDFVLIAIEGQPRVFERSFLERFSAFTEACTTLPHIVQSHSATNYAIPRTRFGMIYKLPAIHIDQPELYAADSVRLMSDVRLVNGLIAKDGRSLVVALKTSGVLDQTQSEVFARALDTLVAQHGLEDAHIAGRAYYQSAFVKNEKYEFTVYTTAASILIFIIVLFLFRRFWGVMLATVSVMMGMILFLGFLVLIGARLDPMSTLFPILMVIVGMSDVIHLMSKYLTETRRGRGRSEAVRYTIKEVGLATFLTSLTTAVGFMSLYTANILPIKKFGLMAAVGVGIAFLTAILFTTAAMRYFGPDHLARIENKRNFWRRLMRKTFIFTRKKRKAIAVGAVVVIGVCLLGVSRVSTDVKLDEQFPRNHKVKRDFHFFEEHYGGLRPFEVAVEAQGDLTMDSAAVIRQIGAFEDYLRQETGLVAVTSPASLYKDFNRAFNDDRVQAHELPRSNERLAHYTKLARSAPPDATKTIISRDRKHGRVTSRFQDLGTAGGVALQDSINTWIAAHADSSVVKYRITGSSLLFDKNNEVVRRNISYGLGLAFLVVSLIMGILFRNWRMVIIALIPNLVPIFVCAALMGYLGMELSAATSIIFAIAFGIAVDDTIHFLSRFRLELSRGRKVYDAVRNTFLETGKAMCMTTVILFFGFVILVTSSYPNTVVIGLLMSLTLVSALIADLLLTPVLIYWLIKDK
jgi:predicted RND superfamily exporter protein